MNLRPARVPGSIALYLPLLFSIMMRTALFRLVIEHDAVDASSNSVPQHKLVPVFDLGSGKWARGGKQSEPTAFPGLATRALPPKEECAPFRRLSEFSRSGSQDTLLTTDTTKLQNHRSHRRQSSRNLG